MPVNFLTDSREERSTLRPANILIYGWVGRKHEYVNLTRISPLVGLRYGAFTMKQAVSKPLQVKWANIRKYVPTISCFLSNAIKCLQHFYRKLKNLCITLLYLLD